MPATDLSSLGVTPELQAWVRTADPKKEIFSHSVTVNLSWWNGALTRRWPSEPPLTAGAGEAGSTSGQATLTRGDLFRLAPAAAARPADACRLLWYALAWGSGLKVRKNLQRMDALLQVPHGAEALVEAARLAHDDPTAAYDHLVVRGRNRIRHLGPAFFTKYFYFAGGPTAGNRSLILDRVVAQALRQLGWKSLRPGGWPTFTYSRYLTLVDRWRAEIRSLDSLNTEPPRRDLFEKYLFTH